MAVQLSGKATLVLLCAMVTLWSISYSPLLARLWPILRGSCAPVPGPVSRWADVWGMGWMRFHDQLVREVQRADQGQVRYLYQCPTAAHASCRVPGFHPTPGPACASVAALQQRPNAGTLVCPSHAMHVTVVGLFHAQGYELIFYGDSISEDWRGTSGGFPWPIGAGTSKVFQAHFAKYRPEVLAIAGETLKGLSVDT